MKLVVSLLLIFLSSWFPEKSDFTVIRAQSQFFAGGTAWSPSGTNYTIELKAERNLTNVRFLAAWTGNKRYTAITATSNGKNVEFSDVSKGETILISFTALQSNRPQKDGDENTSSFPAPEDAVMYGDDTRPPIDFSGAALICYLEKGSKKFLEIPQFEKLKSQPRP